MLFEKRKPAWSVVYVLLMMMLLVFVLESKDGLPDWANEIATLVILFLVFGAMALWVRLNLPTLLQEELRNIKPGEFHIEEIPPSQIESGYTNDDPGHVLGSRNRPH